MMANWIFEISDLFMLTEASGALLTTEGDVLFCRSDLAFEVAGFKAVAETALKYVRLQPGEILVTNDPYSGGNFLSRYTYIMPVRAASSSQPGLVLCLRRNFSATLPLCDKVDEEGLRIPPTPVFQNQQIVSPILEAMSGHPLCPAGFKTWVSQCIEDLQKYFQRWRLLEKDLQGSLSPAEVKNYLKFSQKFAMEKILEQAQGEARSEVRLDSGETLKLHLELQDGMIKADFGGTTSGVKTFLPDFATLGACFEAASEFYGLGDFRNSGTLSLIQVSKPLGCFLNAKYPASTYRGFQEGVAAVKIAMHLALHSIVKNAGNFQSPHHLCFEMSFASGSRWLSQWSARKCCESVSIQRLETQFPVQFISLQKDFETHTMTVELKTLEACQMRWISDFTQHPLKAPKDFKTPAPVLFEIAVDGTTWKPLPYQGQADLLPQTRVRFQIQNQFVKNT